MRKEREEEEEEDKEEGNQWEERKSFESHGCYGL